MPLWWGSSYQWSMLKFVAIFVELIRRQGQSRQNCKANTARPRRTRYRTVKSLKPCCRGMKSGAVFGQYKALMNWFLVQDVGSPTIERALLCLRMCLPLIYWSRQDCGLIHLTFDEVLATQQLSYEWVTGQQLCLKQKGCASGDIENTIEYCCPLITVPLPSHCIHFSPETAPPSLLENSLNYIGVSYSSRLYMAVSLLE